MNKERYKVKVAVYIVLIKNNKVLLQKRKNTNYMDGGYSFPAGHLEKGEGCLNAVIREAKEELNIEIDRSDIEFKQICNYTDENEYILLFFEIKKYSGKLAIMEPNKCDELKFFNVDNLPKNLDIEVVKYFENEKNKLIYTEHN